MRPRATIFLSLIFIAATRISFSQETGNDTLPYAATHRESSKYEVVLDAGYFPLNNNLAGKWQGVYSLRAGAGRLFTENLAFHFFVDYYSYKLFSRYDYPRLFPAGAGMTTSYPVLSTRDDIAFYGAFTIGMIKIGIGGNYSKVYGHGSRIIPFTDSRTSAAALLSPEDEVPRFDIVFMIGLSYDVSLGNKLFIPFGIYLKELGYNNTSIPLLLRIGIAKQF